MAFIDTMNKYIYIGIPIFIIGFVLIGFVLSTTGSSMPNESSSSDAGSSTELESFLKKEASVMDMKGTATVEISIEDFKFTPTVVKISPGTNVIWTNEGNIRHNVSFQSLPEGVTGIKSDLLETDEQYQKVFEQPGTYTYLCDPHPIRMRAAIIVES